MNRYFEYIISLPKSVYFCLRVLPFRQAIKVPVIIRYNTKLLSIHGNIELGGGKFGQVKIGFGNIGCFDKKYERTLLQIDGKVIIKGKCYIGQGSRIIVYNDAVLKIGERLNITASITIICSFKVKFGQGVLISWDVLIMDTDFHEIKYIGDVTTSPVKKDVIIGDNVWLGARVTILKGSTIADNSVVGANSVVNKRFSNDFNVLIAGSPAKIVRRQIRWYK